MREPLRPNTLIKNRAFLFSKKKSQLKILAESVNIPTAIEMMIPINSLFSSI